MSKLIVLIFLVVFSSIKTDESSWIKFIKSFLQKNVDNKVLLSIMEMARKADPHSYNNYEHNKVNFENHKESIRRANGYIEDQHSYGDMKYGIKPLTYNGCGIIATYNALYDLTGDMNIDFPKIIDSYEKDGILVAGHFGTSMYAIEDFFKKNGFRTRSSYVMKDYEEIANECDAFVFTMYNNVEDIFDMLHTVGISKKNGKFYIHNNGRGSASRAYDSITDLITKINNGKAKDIILIGVYKK